MQTDLKPPCHITSSAWERSARRGNCFVFLQFAPPLQAAGQVRDPAAAWAGDFTEPIRA